MDTRDLGQRIEQKCIEQQRIEQKCIEQQRIGQKRIEQKRIGQKCIEQSLTYTGQGICGKIRILSFRFCKGS